MTFTFTEFEITITALVAALFVLTVIIAWINVVDHCEKHGCDAPYRCNCCSKTIESRESGDEEVGLALGVRGGRSRRSYDQHDDEVPSNVIPVGDRGQRDVLSDSRQSFMG